MKKIILLSTGLILMAAQVAKAATVELQFDSLPTDQGWSYTGVTPVSSVASVDGSVLTINTMSLGDVSAWFAMPGIVNPNQPFTLSVRARVLDSESSLPFTVVNPLFFQVHQSFETWLASLGMNYVKTPHDNFMPIDGTQFHDFLIDGIPGVKSDFYIDGVLVESTTPYISNVAFNTIAFGDGNAMPGQGVNGLIEISQFKFVQAVPVPTAIWLFGSGLIGLIGLARRKKS